MAPNNKRFGGREEKGTKKHGQEKLYMETDRARLKGSKTIFLRKYWQQSALSWEKEERATRKGLGKKKLEWQQTVTG